MKRWILYSAWLVLAAGLYFFENNTGSRIILLSSLVLMLLPRIRHILLDPDAVHPTQPHEQKTAAKVQTPEMEENGQIRNYQPGDPISRIHWKLSAKRQTLLVREHSMMLETEETEQLLPDTKQTATAGRIRKTALWVSGAVLFLSALLLLLIPQAFQGLLILLNRLFDASEAVNSYVYEHFTVGAEASATLAAILICSFLASLLGMALITGSRGLMTAIAASCVLFQVYFGLAFPAWANVLLLTAFLFCIMKRPWTRQNLYRILACTAVAALTVLLVWPGADPMTETASESVRDVFSRQVTQVTGWENETNPEAIETRHTHTLSLTEGDQAARQDMAYRLVPVEEEQISKPYWVNYLRIGLLLLLTAVAVILPFVPFMLIEAARRKVMAERKVYQSKDVGEAVCSVFQDVIIWLECTDIGAGNLAYREWKTHLLERRMPLNYTEQFAHGAALFEKAVYSRHPLDEKDRLDVLNLLKETETICRQRADWKQRMRLRYREFLWV